MTFPNHRHRRSRFAAAGLLLLSAAAVWLWAHEGHAPLPTRGAQVDRAAGRLTLSAETRAALDVQTAEVTDRAAPDTVLAEVELVAPWSRHGFASSRLPGRLVAVHARAGQRVAAGDLLAEVSSLELESLRLEVRNARNDIRRAEQVLDVLRSTSGTRPEQERLDAENQLQQHRNALELARAKWSALGLPDADFDTLPAATAPVRSPIAGTVIHADLSVGKIVEPGEHLFEVVDLTKVWAKIGVLERDLNRVHEGQRVELRLTAYPGETFETTVRTTGLALDLKSGLNAVWAELENPSVGEARLVPGMSGRASLLRPAPAGTRTIPAAALIDDGLERYVLVEESNTATASVYLRRPVVVLRQSPDAVVVRSADLFPGDRVVTQGGHELAGFFEPNVLRLSPQASETIGLKVEPLAARAVEDIVTISGEVELTPDRRTVASSPLAGNLARLNIDIGQRVRRGQVLAEIVGTALQQMQLDYLKEQLSFQLLDRQYADLKKIEAAVPRRRLLELESEWTASRNRRDSLRRRLELIGLSAEQLAQLMDRRRIIEAIPIRSPIDGVVVHFDKALGQSIKAEEPLFEVHDLSRPMLRAFVPESDFARVRLPQPARVRFAADRDSVYSGRVVRSARVLSGEAQALSVWIELDRLPEAPLRHGQLARVSVTVRPGSPTPAVPRDAVLRDGAQAFVFVQKPDETFERRAVETGREDDRFVEIVRGAALGERLAVSGVPDLWTANAVIR